MKRSRFSEETTPCSRRSAQKNFWRPVPDGSRRPDEARARWRIRELASMAILRRSKERNVAWHNLAPGKPCQNRFVESFNARLEDRPVAPDSHNVSRVAAHQSAKGSGRRRLRER
ncbi:integrase core domain-containing protein [Aurantiacibacter flavus]|uniref:integrase core domain-containing protein n=1 Tax=Aurantiacibacter flavus TaxID=3145232 RepID=UPI003D22B6E2